eukprot:scaffold15670_cov112-Isochrysis_galbana.AAC.4
MLHASRAAQLPTPAPCCGATARGCGGASAHPAAISVTSYQASLMHRPSMAGPEPRERPA